MASSVRRRDRGAPQRQAARRSPTCPARWSSSRPSTGRPRRATSARSRRRCRRTASRSSPSSTSPRPPGTSTSCRTRSCGPFNCVGIGEGRALGDVEVVSGNVKLAMSHVVPDLVQKIVKGQDPLHILGEGNQVRHYTYGGDLAKGIVECMEPGRRAQRGLQHLHAGVDQVRELAEVIWRKIKGDDVPLHARQRPRLRVRRAEARARRREGQATCSASSAPPRLDEMLDEVIPWVTQAVADGKLYLHSSFTRPPLVAVLTWVAPPMVRRGGSGACRLLACPACRRPPLRATGAGHRPRVERAGLGRRDDQRDPDHQPRRSTSSSSTTARVDAHRRPGRRGRRPGVPAAVQPRRRRGDARRLPLRPAPRLRRRRAGRRRRPARPALPRRASSRPSTRADVVIGSRFAGADADVPGPRAAPLGDGAAGQGPAAGWPTPRSPTPRRASGPPTAAPSPCSPRTTRRSTSATPSSRSSSPCAPAARVTQVPVEMRPRAAGTASASPGRAAVYLFRAVVALSLALVRRWPTQVAANEPVGPPCQPPRAGRP